MNFEREAVATDKNSDSDVEHVFYMQDVPNVLRKEVQLARRHHA